jgi:hypothetical protein
MNVPSMSPTDSRQESNSGLGDCSQLYHCTVPILNFDQAQPAFAGTGVLATVDQKPFVITAAHVFEESFRRVGFAYKQQGKLVVFGGDNLKILTAKAQTGGGNVQRAVYKDGLDLAIVELTGEVLEELQAHYRSYDLRQSSYTTDSAWGVISGWPARKNTYNQRKRLGHFDSCYHIQCPIVDRETLRLVGWNPDVYMGLSADKKKDFANATSGHRIHLPKLEGMSGSGFWVKSSSQNSSASLSWSLTGILVEDEQPKRMLKVIKIEHAWAPLRYWGFAPQSS